MMTMIRVEDIAPLRRPEATGLAEAETARMADLLESLDGQAWSLPTDCPAWDVRAVAGHVLGMTATFTGLRRFARDMRAGGKAAGDGAFIDGLTAVQVRDHAGLSTTELVDRLRTAGPAQAAWRASRRLMRRIPLKQQLRDGEETWRMGYLLDIILTRDTWMHRVDISRAAGQPMELSQDHDGRIVADVVAEWARRHGQPFTLTLDGPAGGNFTSGDGGEQIAIDCIEFCRILAGRAPGVGLLTQEVPF